MNSVQRVAAPAGALIVLWAAALSQAADPAEAAQVTACPRCAWKPPAAGKIVTLPRGGDLANAVQSLQSGTTLLLEDGEYFLRRMADVKERGVVIRSKSGDPSKVTVRSEGMTERKVGVVLSISAPEVTVADLTLGYVGYHAVQVRGEKGASKFVLHNCRLIDTGQQLLKGSFSETGHFADDCTVACSRFEYSATAPGDYTNGVDVIAARGWTVRDCYFRNIRGPERIGYRAGPAILFWGNSMDTRVERNVVVDCFRGIALGLGPGVFTTPRDGDKSVDHKGGVIRNNVVANLNSWANEGIEANAAPGVRIEHNTVFVEGSLPWAISTRFPITTGTVQNNLSNHAATSRDGSKAVKTDNVTLAKAPWFVGAASGDFHLTPEAALAIGACSTIPEASKDFDGVVRPAGQMCDAGAFQLKK